MCDRIGCTHFPKLKDMDFSGRAVSSRRGFLKRAAAVTTISMAPRRRMVSSSRRISWVSPLYDSAMTVSSR